MSTGMWSLIIWRSLTGLFAGSLILVQAYSFLFLFTIAYLLILFLQRNAVFSSPDLMRVERLLSFWVLLLAVFWLR